MFDHPVAGEADEKTQIASNPSYQVCEGGGHGLLLPANNGKDEILLFSTALLLDLNIITLGPLAISFHNTSEIKNTVVIRILTVRYLLAAKMQLFENFGSLP